MSKACRAVFVYGTLMRGQPREGMWPRAAEQIRLASTRARIFDLGLYPAIAAGGDLVAGEVWRLRHEDLQETLDVLDGIEGYHGGRDDLYVRRIVSCQLMEGGSCEAHAYFFADTALLRDTPLITPGRDGYCRWPVPPSYNPTSHVDAERT